MPDEPSKPTGEIVLYQTEDGQTRIQCRFENENVWLTQRLLAALYQVGVNTINHHLKEIYADGELTPEATIRNYRIVQTEGARAVERDMEHYGLEMILAIGYRVRAQRGTQFRQWAIFENEWQSFRTRQDRELELKSAAHTYAKPGCYLVAVKVIDIFGNDTMTLVTVTVG